MKTRRESFYPISTIVLLVIVILLIGFLVGRHQNVLIGKEQAIQYAIQAADPGCGLQSVEPPTETEAELTTWGRAYYGHTPDPERPVWVVTMRGRWLRVGGPLPPPGSNPKPFYEECTIMIDARTGKSLTPPISRIQDVQKNLQTQSLTPNTVRTC